MLGLKDHTVSRKRLSPFAASAALHVLLLAALLYRPGAQILSPSSLMAGEYRGGSVTRLYWVSAAAQRADYHPRPSKDRSRIALRRPPKITLPVPSEAPVQNEEAEANAEPAANSLPPPGSPFGMSEDGSLTGQEIRPALPVATSDPAVTSDDLRGGLQGNEVVEITIDAMGNIVKKVVVQSLGPAVDAKVLAALENWRFRPATRNGVPIPSKQDVYYHFPPRG